MLIVNPSSGKEEGKEFAEDVNKKLLEMFDEVELKWTEKGGDAERFARNAAQCQFDAVFALGGDGTVNECMSGLATESNRPDFGFIPLGTVNDLGRVLGISMDPKEAIKQLTHMKKKEIDMGRINDHYFIDIVAIGSIPEAVHEVPIEKKTKLGPMAYLLEGVKAVADKKVYSFEINCDGEIVELESLLVLVALTNSVAGFQTMIPEAKVDDGYMHILALKGNEIADKLSLIPKIFAGEAPNDENVFYRKFKKGTIILKDDSMDVKANVDGDEGDSLPLDLEILPKHITVYVPDNKE